MTQEVMKPLCEAILADIAQEEIEAPLGAYAAALLVAQSIVRQNFAALSVEDVAKAICRAQFPGYSQEDIEKVKDGTVLWHAYRGSAEAVMQLLRKD